MQYLHEINARHVSSCRRYEHVRAHRRIAHEEKQLFMNCEIIYQ
jgi:hypothetical protein